MSVKYALKKCLRILPDRVFIKIKYRIRTGKKLNLRDPQTYTEKLQWLKLHDRRPVYSTMVDKLAVKDYVAERIGSEHIIPTLGVWDSFQEIDFDALPERFVLKCNHDCGSIVFCPDKKTFDREKAGRFLTKCLQVNYYWHSREWPYKAVKPKILAEEWMTDDATEELRDYKFFCFHGEPKLLFIATDRQKEDHETKFDFFDMDFGHLPFTNGHPNAEAPPEKPVNFEQMKAFARKLSEGIPHVRVDFYEVNGQIYFGEMTFFHWGGMMPFSPEEWDKTLGAWIHLPKADS